MNWFGRPVWNRSDRRHRAGAASWWLATWWLAPTRSTLRMRDPISVRGGDRSRSPAPSRSQQGTRVDLDPVARRRVGWRDDSRLGFRADQTLGVEPVGDRLHFNPIGAIAPPPLVHRIEPDEGAILRPKCGSVPEGERPSISLEAKVKVLPLRAVAHAGRGGEATELADTAPLADTTGPPSSGARSPSVPLLQQMRSAPQESTSTAEEAAVPRG